MRLTLLPLCLIGSFTGQCATGSSAWSIGNCPIVIMRE